MVKIFVTITLLLVARLVINAATLQAKVTDVESGNALVVSNINRPLRVRLKAIAPPEPGQPFSEAARDHLRALILNKAVAVEYTHLSSGYLEAKVSLNGIDIGSQMLRDGVAWYDRGYDYALTAADRDLYAQCEQAARAEKRGLWNDSRAKAPWEFRKAQQDELAKLAPTPTQPSFQSVRRKAAARASSFSNNDLMGGMIAPGTIAGPTVSRQIAPNSLPGEWVRFSSEEGHFSVRLPGNSYQHEYPVLDSEQKLTNINYLVGNEDGSLYMVMWTKGPNQGLTNTSAAADTIKGLVIGINQNLERAGRTERVTANAGRDVKFGEYVGRQYTLRLGSLSAAVRVLSKQIGDERAIFMIGSFAGPGSEPSLQFLNSLKITQ